MPAKRIIPCLDVRHGRVVKGVKFRNHIDIGDPVELAMAYARDRADELVFYDITASPEGRSVAPGWIKRIAEVIDIPFSVAGGIRSLHDAALRLQAGADKISVNTPALERPGLIDDLVREFGSQCIVLGVDSRFDGQSYVVHQYTGDPDKTKQTHRKTLDWVTEAIDRGIGEIVLNCMDQDGVRDGYDINQLQAVRAITPVPLVASGGAGKQAHFRDVFEKTDVDGALAASVFHKNILNIPTLKTWLIQENIEVRP